MLIERRCRITGVDNPIHLVASHCKPWRDSTNEERLNGENGLLLTPGIDHLFARGFVGFEDSGRLVISPVAHRPSLERMGVDTRGAVNVGGFNGVWGRRTELGERRLEGEGSVHDPRPQRSAKGPHGCPADGFAGALLSVAGEWKRPPFLSSEAAEGEAKGVLFHNAKRIHVANLSLRIA